MPSFFLHSASTYGSRAHWKHVCNSCLPYCCPLKMSVGSVRTLLAMGMHGKKHHLACVCKRGARKPHRLRPCLVLKCRYTNKYTSRILFAV